MISPLFLLSIYVAAVLESRLADGLAVAGVVPDLMALVTLVWLTGSEPRAGVLMAAIVGLLCDLTQSTLLGPGAAAFAVTAFFVASLLRRFQLDQLTSRVGVIALAVTSIELMRSAAARCTGQTLLPIFTLANRSLLAGIYTAGIAVPLLMILGWQTQQRAEALVRE